MLKLTDKKLSRRHALKALGAAIGATTVTALQAAMGWWSLTGKVNPGDSHFKSDCHLLRALAIRQRTFFISLLYL